MKKFKISDKFSGYKKTKAIILAIGTLHAKMYLMEKGEIKTLGGEYMEKPKYTDREGLFARKGRGADMGFGSVYENKRDYSEDKFLSSLVEKLEVELRNFNPEIFYIFAPEHELRTIEKKLPAAAKEIRRKVFLGNLVDEHPFRLLFEIKKVEEKIGRSEPRKKRGRELYNRKGILEKSE